MYRFYFIENIFNLNFVVNSLGYSIVKFFMGFERGKTTLLFAETNQFSRVWPSPLFQEVARHL